MLINLSIKQNQLWYQDYYLWIVLLNIHTRIVPYSMDQPPVNADKRKALKSFLQANDSTKDSGIKLQKEQQSQQFQEEYVEASNDCVVCRQPLPNQKDRKACGFCKLPVCKDHLRKRRPRKNKWEKICDNCEDQFLFDLHMKVQKRAEESLMVAEEITIQKYDNLKEVLENKMIKRRELSFKEAELQNKHQQQMAKFEKQNYKFQSTNNKIESLHLQCGQIQEYIKRIQGKVKENYYEDFNILQEQNDKLGKQLTRAQKKCMEVRIAIQKRQKQLEEAYDLWEQKQYAKSQQEPRRKKPYKPDEKCRIF